MTRGMAEGAAQRVVGKCEHLMIGACGPCVAAALQAVSAEEREADAAMAELGIGNSCLANIGAAHTSLHCHEGCAAAFNIAAAIRGRS